ncbi:hypothetical protein COT97_05935, partial [Candidatus Falkowbacteria bacterium CG10_big_fil_rev_8_21_14_0_10_39_11]
GKVNKQSCDFYCNANYEWYQDFTETKTGIAIDDCEELQKIGNDSNYPLNGAYYLADNIDCSATNPSDPDNKGSKWDNGGLGFDPIGGQSGFQRWFGGSLDGNCHTISNLYINRQVGKVGLFSTIGSQSNSTNFPTVVIKNLTLDNINISGSGYIGGVAASGSNFAFDNISVRGNIRMIAKSGDFSIIGGLIGWGRIGSLSYNNFVGKIDGRSYIGGIIGSAKQVFTKNNYTVADIHGSEILGGIFGGSDYQEDYIVVTDSYATGPIHGSTNNSIGGLGGEMHVDSQIINSYSTSLVTSDLQAGSVGGLAGSIRDRSYIQNSYWAKDTSGQSKCVGSGSDSGCTGVNEANLLGDKNPFYKNNGWDFKDTWTKTATHPLLNARLQCGACVESLVSPCRDTDNGKDIFVKGETYDKGADKPFVDSCADSTHVREYWCDENSRLASSPIVCPDTHVCSDGACIE